MSHLTASPFHKPSPFVFPREPITPPETLTDTAYPSTTALPPTVNEPRHEDNIPSAHFETPSHPRVRQSSISYQNSGFRETPIRPVHRNYRFFVVIIPPSCLIEEHGQLGHNLASGPPHRLSQGIIMPLFPTMYGQLTAIAKEFNFPSTTGLCLYLHFNENGVVMTPRISDDSWHLLWNHLFDMPAIPRGFPIGGKIEFDIDFRQARWYSSWLSTLGRDHFEPPVVPSTVPVHGRSSDFINADDSPDFDNVDAPQSTPYKTRHVPRKLSLVDRLDVPTSRPDDSRGTTRGLELPDHGVPISKTLSPIAQEEEPPSARDQLDNRVRSWRASAIVKPTSLAQRGQTSLEPLNLPNNVTLDEDSSTSLDLELNLEDFTWSISSMGPEDYDITSVETLSERLPSPDIARRMFDDSPPTPSTVTSWGAPLSYPPSPLSDFRPPSLDLGFRNIFSPPLTPVTATSWGPTSPAMSTYGCYQEVPRPESVHLGDRGQFSRPVTPSTATSWGAPLSYPPTPVTPYRAITPDIAQRSFDHAQENGFLTPRSYLRSAVGEPWSFVWPYLKTHEVLNTKIVKESTQNTEYPYFSIYPPIYPYFDLYPTAAASRSQQVSNTSVQYPGLQIFHPHNVDEIDPEVHTGTEELGLIPVIAQYPKFNLYPAALSLVQRVPAIPSPCSGCSYPAFDIYTPVYPHLDTHLTVEGPVSEAKSISYGAYPNIVIYPVIYPHFDLYPDKAIEAPGRKTHSQPRKIHVNLPGHYPSFNIYPAAYPNFSVYPASLAIAERKSIRRSSVIISTSQYPDFELYPAVYPHLSLYPPPARAGETVSKATGNIPRVTKIVVPPSSYPVIRPYPPVYPHFELYPLAAPVMADTTAIKKFPVLVLGRTTYPTIHLYPPVHPHLFHHPLTAKPSEAIPPSVTLSDSYPFLQIYTPVYPHLGIYPSIATSQPSPMMNEDTVMAVAKTQVTKRRRSHRELHQEVLHSGSLHTSSDIVADMRPEPDLRPLNTATRRDNRRIAATRSPTGPALHRPATPPALPSPSRKLPTPPSMDGGPRSPNVLEQMASYKAETFPARRYSPTVRSPSRTAATTTLRVSMISPLRQMPLPRSAESLVYPDAPATPMIIPSGLTRTRSVGGNSDRTNSVRPRVRDSSIVPRTRDL